MEINRILYVITDLQIGGVPLHLLRLAAHVRGLGTEVTVVSLKPKGPVAVRLEAVGVNVLSCGASWPADWRVIERLVGIVCDLNPDVIHSLLFHANTAARAACVLSGFPVDRLACEIQTVEIERGWHLAVDRVMGGLGRFTIGNSPAVIEHLCARAGIAWERLRLVPGGVDVEAIRNAKPLSRASLGVADDEVLLFWAGRLDPVKGLDVLIEAVASLRSRLRLKLLLAGEGEHRRYIEQEIARHSVSNCVTLLGSRDDVPGLLRTADLFVFPSRTEGLPNALLEAMAASVPVVVTDVPGCRELVTDGVTGLVVPLGDAGALADAIVRCAKDKRLSESMSANARHFVADTFTLGRCLDRYVDLYRALRSPAV